MIYAESEKGLIFASMFVCNDANQLDKTCTMYMNGLNSTHQATDHLRRRLQGRKTADQDPKKFIICHDGVVTIELVVKKWNL